MFYASVVCGGRVLRVWSCAVAGLHVNKPVLQEINDVNRSLVFARVSATDAAVWVEGCLPIETLRPHDVGFLCSEVGRTADRIGSMLAAVHGGLVAFPDAAEAGHEHED